MMCVARPSPFADFSTLFWRVLKKVWKEQEAGVHRKLIMRFLFGQDTTHRILLKDAIILLRLLCVLGSFKERCHENTPSYINILREIVTSTLFDILQILGLHSRYEVSLEYIFLLHYLRSYGLLVLVALRNRAMDFVSFIHLSQHLLMLHDRSIVCFEHDLRRLDGLHLLNVVDKNGVIFGALQADLGCVMFYLHVLLVHNSCGDFMSWHTLLP